MDTETNQKSQNPKKESSLSPWELVVSLILMLDEAAGYNIPVLSLIDVAEASSYVSKGAFGKPFFIVCNKDEVAEALAIKLDIFRKRRKELDEQQSKDV